MNPGLQIDEPMTELCQVIQVLGQGRSDERDSLESGAAGNNSRLWKSPVRCLDGIQPIEVGRLADAPPKI